MKEGEGAHPLLIALGGLGVAIAVVLAGYCGWFAVWVLVVEGDETATTLDRLPVTAIGAVGAACLTYAALGLVRYCRGRKVRAWVIAGTYLAGLLAIPVFWFAYLAYISGG